jgi:P27 family predicted phage terminase small subunit
VVEGVLTLKGRPPKSLEQHQLDGTYRADRHGDAGQAVQPAGEPQMPLEFAGEARACWESVVAPLVALKVAKAIDQPALVALCEWWARYRLYSSRLDRPETIDLDVLDQSRLVRIAANAWSEFSRLAARFGLTPADRQRLRVQGEGKKKGVMSRPR